VHIPDNTALIIDEAQSSVIGQGAVITLDLRSALLELGEDGGYIIANGLMDVFPPGEKIAPSDADISISPIHAPTPVIQSLNVLTPVHSTSIVETPTPLIKIVTATISEELPLDEGTKPPRPTITPPIIPPPANPNQTNLMVGIIIFIVFVILFAVWLNRKRYIQQ
jgi:hypothetical protein